MARTPPTDEDKRAAVLELLEALGRGDDLEVIVENARLRHRKNDTLPGDVFLDVARDALDPAGATRGEPIDFGRLIELIGWQLGGRQSAKLQYAVLAAATGRGGIEPDLLAEVQWWQTDDFWFYATRRRRLRPSRGRAPPATIGRRVRRGCCPLALTLLGRAPRAGHRPAQRHDREHFR